MTEQAISRSSPRTTPATAAAALAVAALAVADLAALAASLAVAVGLRVSVLPALSEAFARPTFPLSHYFELWWLPLVYVGALWHVGLYSRRDPFWEEVRRCVGGVTTAAVLIFAVMSIARIADDVSRPVVVAAWAVLLGALPLARYAAKRSLIALGPWRRRALLVGCGPQAEVLRAALARDRTLGYEVAGVVATPAHAPERAAALGAREVILTAPRLEREEFLRLVERLREVAENVIIAPDLAEVPVLGVEVLGLFEDRTLLLRVPNNLLKPWNLAVKRASDLVLGSLAALVALPVVAVAGAFVALTSPGPVLHVEPRVGRKHRLFDCLKLRTMYVDADARLQAHLAAHPDAAAEWERYRKLRAYDPRVTPVGRWLRRYALDELPQVVNVLRGDMSLVGPRPYLPREMPLPEGDGILDVRPGMTGLWQVSGKNALAFEQRGQLDRWYVSNWSLWLDLVILVKTVPMVLRGERHAGRPDANGEVGRT
ncbi:MAG: exopolysaccharide biosynthesis polyprenyl glycosylphosphotransferase [Armatimonadota bacterium]|nr:exopolysaccharide biosynthesis polyprenyl glycosylphosphotransferase [Armatimonadota bacterium]MDR7457599.1 exopolysaccharide biosynthesis polyprenyl glycosylphosphotransferase [Armatimonadota bacterium]MDR7496647.1 exopolysaccharide biosynthesis polyprenyl glycosylphosphotransferase [Armatimonadota bacterium]